MLLTVEENLEAVESMHAIAGVLGERLESFPRKRNLGWTGSIHWKHNTPLTFHS